MNETCNPERPDAAAEQPVAREALEAQLRLVVEQLPAHLWTTDAELRVSSVLGSTFAQLDVAPSTYVSKLIPDLAPDAPSIMAAHQAALQGESGEYERTFRERVFACRMNPLRNAQGEIVGCVGLALDITERRRAEQRLAIEYEVNRVLSEAPSLREAAPSVLRAIGEGLGWEYGGFWTVDHDGNTLRCQETWAAPSVDIARFVTASREMTFARGEGLPGSVWASGEPRWVIDTAAESSFLRLQVASSEGLRSGFGLPVTLDGRVVAVIEFFGRQIYQPNPEMLELVTVLSGALGQFTERKRVEEERALLASAVEFSYDAVINIALDGTILSWNPGAERLFGYTPEEVKGKSISQLCPADRHDEQRAALEVLGRGEPVWRLETQRVRNDGRLVDVAIVDSPVQDSSGTIVGVVSIVQDVTERKHTEEALRTSEERFRTAFAVSAVGQGLATLERRIVEVNPAFVAITGYSQEELVGRDFLSITHPDDRELNHALVRQLIGGEAAHIRMEKRYLRPDGSVVPVIIDVALVRDAAGHPTALNAVVQDISERKRAEEALQTRVAQQQAVAAFGEYALATPDLTAVMAEAVTVVARTLDVEHCKLLELLPGGEALLLRAGYGWGEEVGRAILPSGTGSQGGYTLLVGEPVISPDIRAETRFSPPPLLFAHGVVGTMSVAVPGEPGPFGALQADATRPRSFSDDDAAFLRAVANVLATAIRRKDFEERLAHEHAEAERLEALERARSEFLASISHDLKTPLTAAQFGIGMLEMSTAERLRQEERELFGSTLRSIHRLGFLIDDLLAYNRLATDSLHADREPLDLREVIANALPSVHLLMQWKEQTLTVDMPEALWIAGDAQQLEHVVVNLLANAHRHTSAGTQITVSGRVVDGEVRLTISDTGPGIPTEDLERIFQRFYRSPVTSGAGSGLGLAITKDLVERHGGRIWAESTPGQGAHFHIALPVRQEEPSHAA